MASFNAKKLAEGQLPNVLGDLYVCPGGTKSYIKFWNLFNAGAGTQTIELYYNTRKLRRIELEVNEAYNVLEEDRSIELNSGDALRAVTTDASSVDFVITGVEET